MAEGIEVGGADPAIVGESGGFGWVVDGGDAVDPALAFEEHGADEGGGLDSRDSAEFVEDAVVEGGANFVFLEVFALEIDVGSDDVVGREAFVEG